MASEARESDEGTPFIRDELYERVVEKQQNSYNRSFWNRFSWFAFHVIIIGLNAALLIFNFTYGPINPQYNILSELQDKTTSPARSSLAYTIEPAEMSSPSIYFGKPSREVDQAWSKLLKPSMIRLSTEELRSMNKTSVAHKDGGYIGYMESMHMLHCLKRIYQYQYKDYYHALANDTESLSPGHWAHCLEILREGIMCNADVTINTYSWKTDERLPIAKRKGYKKCTDWNRVTEWLEKRTILVDREIFIDQLVRHHE